MKIKKWLIVSYIFVMMIPMFAAFFIYQWIASYNTNVEVSDYVNNLTIFDKYEKLLQDQKLYLISSKERNLVDEKEKNKVEITLYDKDGLKIYSSIKGDMFFYKAKEQLYSGLYELKHGYKADSIKKPVFKNNEIVGFYEIVVARTKWIEGVNNRTILGCILFLVIFIVVLISVIKIINRKVNKPLSCLINVMGRFAAGEEAQIQYNVNDEIGELIEHFNRMKDEIEEKTKQVTKEQKAKEYMIAAISHDLKTPLTAIRAYTELLQSQNPLLEEEKDKDTSIILSKCDYMKNMIDDLLMYTVLSTDYKMDLVNVEGEEFFEMLFSGHNQLCEKNQIKFLCDISVEGTYKVDVKQMVRVVDNLISNAIRYTPKGKNIYLGAYSEEFQLPCWIDDNFKLELNEFRKDGVVFIVKNDGDKISKENINKIYEPFYKLDDSRNEQRKSGTGLGLSIVKLIIEKHEGKIKLLSESDKGTIIACYIRKAIS
ncbi:HAMP domain-containing sensor histidine kinase [Clostridium sp. MB40-C1]|uniref:HAMP domain-containing sensor histidine kinase n=1 Tax=Clostridium sp. MB40-C1 TaxID=3070996 RepID=UPI0027E11131|nr:HAMP domain-containing sensor histidine kinase [Clostridium sp. MB40-C1]WMJ80942.1 HAMP domain-containing sensor histidine kinase [Clostridium sp. MB40-C1]